MNIKVSDFVANFLVHKKLVQMFGITGGGAMHLNESFRKENKINFVYTHHEQTAAMAAESYFRASSKPAVIHTTSGPGGTNAITGVVGSWIDSIPTFIISGQVPTNNLINNTRTRQIGIQEINIIDIVKPITKYAVLIKNPYHIRDELEKCYDFMMEGRPGPVWIDIPLDIQSKIINTKKILNNYKKKSKNKKIYKKNEYKKFYDLINSCKKPVLILGNGIHISKTEKKCTKFIKNIKFPIISSWNASDLINSDDKLYIGRMGIFGDRASNLAVENSDLIIVIGSKLSITQTGYLTKLFAKNSKKILIDIDKNELNKNLLSNVVLKIQSDLNNFFDYINSKLNKKYFLHNDISKWTKLVHQWKIKYPVIKENHKKNRVDINSFFFIEKLSNACRGTETIITDMGTSFTCTMQTFKIKNYKKQRLFTSSGLAAMGFGLPGAIGAAFANLKKKVICINGDGGMMFNIQELQTIKHYNLPIKVFILENKGYLTMQLMQKKNFNKLVGADKNSGISFPSFNKIAKGFGLKYTKLKSKNISQQIKKILSSNSPEVIEVKMPALQPLIPRIQSRLMKDGSFASVRLDDLYPHLPKKILESERKKANFNIE